MMDILTFTTLYPNAAQPGLGIFVEQRLRQLVASGAVRSRVVAPVPWFPFSSARFGRYAVLARVPAREERHGLSVDHPRYPLLPRLGMTLAPIMMATAVQAAVTRLSRSESSFRVIDAHYFYPDGVAAVLLGRRLGRPVVVTARGTDVNLIPQHRLPRRQILWAARQAAAIVTVCQALKDRLVELGVPPDKMTVLRNGVDLDFFRPGDREFARRRLGFDGITLLSVGYLIERKGHHIAIQALAELPGVRLVIVGGGEFEARLRQLAQSFGVADRVRFEGPVAQSKLRDYYLAADALVLASSREGMANVLLESLACGTPVIATAEWGTPEVVRGDAAGVLMERRDAGALVRAYHRLFARYPDRAETRRYAESFGWEPTTEGQLRIFERVRIR